MMVCRGARLTAMQTSSAMVKGTACKSTGDWIQRHYGAAAWQTILAALPDDSRRQMERPTAFSWYPLSLMDTVFAGVAVHCLKGETAKFDATFRKLGAYIAADNLGTIYKMVLAFAKPSQIYSMLPRLWTTYFDQISVSLDEPRLVDGRYEGVCRVKGCDLSFVAPAAAGWIEFAYQRVGCQNAQVVERGFALGRDRSDSLAFDVSWTVT